MSTDIFWAGLASPLVLWFGLHGGIINWRFPIRPFMGDQEPGVWHINFCFMGMFFKLIALVAARNIAHFVGSALPGSVRFIGVLPPGAINPPYKNAAHIG